MARRPRAAQQARGAQQAARRARGRFPRAHRTTGSGAKRPVAPVKPKGG